MKNLALAAFPLKAFPVIGFLLFSLSFVGVIYWVFFKQNPKVYEHLSRLPLEEEKS